MSIVATGRVASSDNAPGFAAAAMARAVTVSIGLGIDDFLRVVDLLILRALAMVRFDRMRRGMSSA